MKYLLTILILISPSLLRGQNNLVPDILSEALNMLSYCVVDNPGSHSIKASLTIGDFIP